MRYLLFISLAFCSLQCLAQLSQPKRYEMEKQNTDDYFTVLPSGQEGVIILRDTDDYRKGEGDVWHVVSLDTDLEERWNKEITIDVKFNIKAYDLKDNHVYLVFREGEYAKSDYHLIRIGVLDGEVERFDISNEIELELSHLTLLGDRLILGGYVRYSPTLMSYKLGNDKLEVVPGFFKDRSDIVDLRANDNNTFNVVTLEKDYAGWFLRLRMYSQSAEILFEREVRMQSQKRVLSAKSTGFVNGNIALAGTYGASKSNYSQGVYFAVVKPEGQDNIIKYYPFSEFEHFFDYMKPSRASRLKEKAKKRAGAGKEYKFSQRLLLNQLRSTTDGYLLSAEVYHPRFDQTNRRPFFNDYFGMPYTMNGTNFDNRAYSRYSKQPNSLVNLENANGFEYHQAVVIELGAKGGLKWDNSFAIDDIETQSLEQVVHLGRSGDKINMVYLHEDVARYKTIEQDEDLDQGEQELTLLYGTDEVKHNYGGIGGAIHWYDEVFLVWGYQRVENEVVPDVEPRRNVLFINKLVFE